MTKAAEVVATRQQFGILLGKFIFTQLVKFEHRVHVIMFIIELYSLSVLFTPSSPNLYLQKHG
jgi:hypothetical protein